MSAVPASTATRAPDLLDTLAGLAPGSPVFDLRSKRSEIAQHIQGSYDALLEPADFGGVSAVERGLVALRSALPTGSTPVANHYRAYLAHYHAPTDVVAAASADVLAAPLSPRQIAILRHVDLLTNEPVAATPAHLAELQARGLSTPDIVTISQLIAFVSFQVRVLTGLQILGGNA